MIIEHYAVIVSIISAMLLLRQRYTIGLVMIGLKGLEAYVAGLEHAKETKLMSEELLQHN